jgi:hypothetical protein
MEFHDFYTIKPSWVGDFGAKICYFTFLGGVWHHSISAVHAEHAHQLLTAYAQSKHQFLTRTLRVRIGS